MTSRGIVWLSGKERGRSPLRTNRYELWLLAAAWGIAPVKANLLQYGSFETPNEMWANGRGINTYTFPSCPTAFGWFMERGSIDIMNCYTYPGPCWAPNGYQIIDINGNAPGGICQYVMTPGAGARCTLTYSYSPNTGGGWQWNEVRGAVFSLSWGQANAVNWQYGTAWADFWGGGQRGRWTSFSITLTSGGSYVPFCVVSNGPNSPYGTLLDDLVLTCEDPPAPAPSPTSSSTAQPTQTRTSDPTPSSSSTRSADPTQTPSGTGTPSNSRTSDPTPTNTRSGTKTQTGTPSQTATNSETATNTQTPSETASNSATRSSSPTSTFSSTGTGSLSISVSSTETSTSTVSVSFTSSTTSTGSITPSVAASPSETPSNSPTASNTPSNSGTRSSTGSATSTASVSTSFSQTITASISMSLSHSATASLSFGASPSSSTTASGTVSTSYSPSTSFSPTVTPSRSFSSSPTMSIGAAAIIGPGNINGGGSGLAPDAPGGAAGAGAGSGTSGSDGGTTGSLSKGATAGIAAGASIAAIVAIIGGAWCFLLFLARKKRKQREEALRLQQGKRASKVAKIGPGGLVAFGAGPQAVGVARNGSTSARLQKKTSQRLKSFFAASPVYAMDAFGDDNAARHTNDNHSSVELVSPGLLGSRSIGHGRHEGPGKATGSGDKATLLGKGGLQRHQSSSMRALIVEPQAGAGSARRMLDSVTIADPASGGGSSRRVTTASWLGNPLQGQGQKGSPFFPSKPAVSRVVTSGESESSEPQALEKKKRLTMALKSMQTAAASISVPSGPASPNVAALAAYGSAALAAQKRTKAAAGAQKSKGDGDVDADGGDITKAKPRQHRLLKLGESAGGPAGASSEGGLASASRRNLIRPSAAATTIDPTLAAKSVVQKKAKKQFEQQLTHKVEGEDEEGLLGIPDDERLWVQPDPGPRLSLAARRSAYHPSADAAYRDERPDAEGYEEEEGGEGEGYAEQQGYYSSEHNYSPEDYYDEEGQEQDEGQHYYYEDDARGRR